MTWSPTERAERYAKIVKLWNQGLDKKTIKLRIGASFLLIKTALEDARVRGEKVR